MVDEVDLSNTLTVSTEVNLDNVSHSLINENQKKKKKFPVEQVRSRKTALQHT